jgi:hypothetical protein
MEFADVFTRAKVKDIYKVLSFNYWRNIFSKEKGETTLWRKVM